MDSSMRLVLDTYILISALFWDGNERKLLRLCRKREHQLIISPQILDELSRVLLDKFKLPIEKITEYQEEILLTYKLALPIGDVDIIKDDPTDNIMLETAKIGKADKIITGDKHLLSLKKFEGTKITKSIDL